MIQIESKGFTIDLSSKEFWNMGFWIKESLIATIKSHYVNYQDSWKDQEDSRVQMVKTIFTHLARLDIYESMLQEIEDIFKEHNSKKL